MMSCYKEGSTTIIEDPEPIVIDLDYIHEGATVSIDFMCEAVDCIRIGVEKLINIRK